MEQLRFKLNDRVVGKEGVPYIGEKVGTVVFLANNLYNYDYGIQFDSPVENGHDLGDALKYKNGYCRSVYDYELDPALYFVDARVGDSVYDMACGTGIIEEIKLNEIFPLKVRFDGIASTHCFTLEGKINNGLHQTLFYSKPVFELPPPPKRKVKKVIEGWVAVYPISLYSSKEVAQQTAFKDNIGVTYIRHEYEE